MSTFKCTVLSALAELARSVRSIGESMAGIVGNPPPVEPVG